MAIGFRPLPLRGGGATNTTLTAAAGSFTLTGVAALFNVTMPSAAGSYALTGNAATLNTTFASAAGSYAVTGVAAGFAVKLTANTGAYTVTGVAATFATGLTASAASYAVTGNAATTAVNFAGSAGGYTITGVASVGAVSLLGSSGSYTITGNDASYSYDYNLGSVGGRMSGGTFSRGRWRQLKEDEARKLAADEAAHELQAARDLEIARAHDANSRAAVRARWAQEDALAGARRHAAAVDSAAQALAAVQRIGRPHVDIGRLQAIAAANARREQDDEDEALMLLLHDE